MKNKYLCGIILAGLTMSPIQNTQEPPKDSYCVRGYYGVKAILYIDLAKKKTEVFRTLEFLLLECLEYKVKEFKETNERKP